MIVDQLFTPKPLKEGGPYDLPGIDYDRPGDTPRRPRPQGNTTPRRHPDDPDFMDPDQRRLRADQARVKKAQDEYHAKKGVAESTGQDSKSWMASIEQHYPGVKFVQAKMPGAPIIALVNGKPVAQFDIKKGVSESKRNKQRKLNEAWLMEDPVYRRFKRVGRYISEQKLTEPEILQIFADAETGMTDKATGANRTFAGRGKDATVDFAKDVAGAVNGVLNSIQNSVPVAAVDVAYDQATDALANLTGGQKGAAMEAIKKYRNLVKQYPKTAGFAKAALVAIAGLATGGAGLPAIAGLTYALDSAIKGDKLSSVIGKGAGTAALAAAGQGVFGGATQPGTGSPADTSAFTNVNQMGDYTGDYVNMPDPSDSVGALVEPTELATYTVKSGDTLSQIAQANDTTVQELIGLNPQLAAGTGATGGQSMNPDVLFPGDQITLPPATPGANVYAGGVGTNANTMADIAKGQVPDSAITQGMAAKGRAAAGGNQFDLPTADAAQNAAADTKAAADYAAAGPAEKAEILKTTGMTADQLTQLNPPKIDYSQAGPMSTDSLGQKLEYGIPVNNQGSFVPPNPSLPAEELAKQTAAYNSWKADFMKRFPNATLGADGVMQGIKPGLAPMQILTKPTLPAAVQESVKFKILPASKLIDQKATVLNWALNESVGRRSKSVNLTTIGTYTVFENVERYRKALLEYAGGTQPGRPELPDQYRPDMPGGAGVPSKPGLIGRGLNWLDKKAGQVGGALSNFGHQFTTNVTKEKLKMNWHQAGKPSDSDQLAAWLVGQGVPQEVVTSVYGKMSIPYTAPTTPSAALGATAEPAQDTPVDAKAQKELPWLGKDLTTGKNRTVDQITAKPTDPTDTTDPTVSAPGTTTVNPAGFNAANIMKLPGMEKYAKKPTPVKTPNFAQQGGGYAKVNQPTTVSYSGMSGTKPAAPTIAPAGTKVTAGGPTADEKAILDQRIAQALKQPVAEMLQMVETKEDVQRIKQFVDQTFTRYGAVNESAFAVRNQILEHVTQVGARRRREFARKG
jgi:hypothetical protein